MMIRSLAAMAALNLAILPVTVSAQEAANPADSPTVVARRVEAATTSGRLTLPANTPITVRMNEEITTQRNREGESFYLSVVSDVVRDGYVIIPAGSRAVGRITWLTKKGMFGKSGKMDVSIEAIEVGGTRVPTVGTFRQEGEGNTVATVGVVILAGVFAAFVTGRSGVIPAGRELEIHTRNDFTVALANAPAPVATPVSSPAAEPVDPAAPSGR